MSFAPLLVIGALLVVMLVLSNRSKTKRAAADVERRKAMVAGTEVMTSSGLFGTITAVDPDNDGGQADTVTLRVAPGVEVRWALAAVKEAPQRVTAAPALETDAVTGSTTTPDAVDPTVDTTSAGPVRFVKPKGRAVER